MIKVEQIMSGKNEKSRRELETFLNKIGEDNIINIAASPDAISSTSPITPTTMYTVIYKA